MPLAPLLTPPIYYNEQQVSTPANTNDKSTTVNLGLVVLQSVQILWAPGHNALTGVRLTLDNVQILPWNQSGVFIFDSATRREFSIGMLLQHPIIVHTHNADSIVHTHFLTFVYVDVQLASDVQPNAPLPILV